MRQLRVGQAVNCLLVVAVLLGASAGATAGVDRIGVAVPALGGDPPSNPRDGDGDAAVDPQTGTVTNYILVEDGQGNTSWVPEDGGGGGGRSRSPVFWRVTKGQAPPPVPGQTGTACDRESPQAFWYHYELVNSATGEIVYESYECLGPSQDPASEIPGGALPTVEEILEAAQLRPPNISLNPSGRGATGMETWLWAADAQTVVDLETELRGWVVDTHLEVTEWRWSVEGETYTSAGPGSEDDPAARHEFNVKGTHEITVEVTWTGSYTVSGLGISYDGGELSATLEDSVDYPVIEIVAVPDDPER